MTTTFKYYVVSDSKDSCYPKYPIEYKFQSLENAQKAVLDYLNKYGEELLSHSGYHYEGTMLIRPKKDTLKIENKGNCFKLSAVKEVKINKTIKESKTVTVDKETYTKIIEREELLQDWHTVETKGYWKNEIEVLKYDVYIEERAIVTED